MFILIVVLDISEFSYEFPKSAYKKGKTVVQSFHKNLSATLIFLYLVLHLNVTHFSSYKETKQSISQALISQNKFLVCITTSFSYVF